MPRTKIHHTDADRKAAKAGYNLKYRNITVDADLQDKLHDLSDRLVDTFGFKPTISQTLRWLITKGVKP